MADAAAAPEMSKLQSLKAQAAEVQAQIDALKPEVEEVAKQVEAETATLQKKQGDAAEDRQQLDKQLKDHKSFVSATLKSQGNIHSTREDEKKEIEERAAEALEAAQELRTNEEDVLREIAECRAASDAIVTGLEAVAKTSDQQAKQEEVQAAKKVSSLESNAVEKIEKLKKGTEQARKELDAETATAESGDKKKAEAVAQEGEKRQKAIQAKRERMMALEAERLEVTPGLVKASADRRAVEAECSTLRAQYDAVATSANEEEKKLLDQKWALEERLANATKATEDTVALQAAVEELERQLADEQLAHDIEDASHRSANEGAAQATATEVAKLQAKTANACQGMAESRAEFAEKLEKAGQQQAKLRAQLMKETKARQLAEESVAEQVSDLNKARAQVLVGEERAAKKQRK